MKTIVSANEKGGVGKTSLAIHLAAGLAIQGQTVILIDGDPQGHSTLGLRAKKEPQLYELMARDAEWENVLRTISPEVYASDSVQGQLMLLPSNIETKNLANMSLNAFQLRERLAEISDSVDTVIIDTSPTPSDLHAAFYMAADFLVHPTTCDAWSIDGLRESIKRVGPVNVTLNSRGLPPIATLGLVPMMYRNTNEHNNNLDSLRYTFGDKVWTPISMSVIWTEAAREQRTVFSYAPDSKVIVKAINEMSAIINKMKEALNGATQPA